MPNDWSSAANSPIFVWSGLSKFVKLLCLFIPTFSESIEDFSHIIFHRIKLDPFFTPLMNWTRHYFQVLNQLVCWNVGSLLSQLFSFNNEQNNVFKQKRLNLNIDIRRSITVLLVFFVDSFDFFIQVNSILYLQLLISRRILPVTFGMYGKKEKIKIWSVLAVILPF